MMIIMSNQRHFALFLFPLLTILAIVCSESGPRRNYCRLTKTGYHCLVDQPNKPLSDGQTSPLKPYNSLSDSQISHLQPYNSLSDHQISSLKSSNYKYGGDKSNNFVSTNPATPQKIGGILKRKVPHGSAIGKHRKPFLKRHKSEIKKSESLYKKSLHRKKAALYKRREKKRKGWNKKAGLSDGDRGKRILPGGGNVITTALSAVATSLAMGLAVGAVNNVKLTEGDDRIFRGREVDPNSWPWIAKIKTLFRRGNPSRRDFRRSCGGALITERFVVTARHCVSWDTGEVVNGRFVTVWLGSHANMGLDGVKMDVKRVIARRDYQKPTCAPGMWCPPWAFWSHRTLTNDIALLELEHLAPPSPKIQPIRIAQETYVPGTQGFVAGWGLNGRHHPYNLQFVEMTIMKNGFRECKQQMSEGKLCALGRAAGGPCPGDSGSPMVVYNPVAGPSLVGLVSNGAKSCESGLPGIFTKVSHYVEWIDLVLAMAEREYYGFVPRSEVVETKPQGPQPDRPQLAPPLQKYLTQPGQKRPIQLIPKHPIKLIKKHPTQNRPIQLVEKHPTNRLPVHASVQKQNNWHLHRPNHLLPRRGHPMQRFHKRRRSQASKQFYS